MVNSPHRFAISAPAVFDGDQFRENHCVVIEGGCITELIPARDCPPDLPLTQLPSGTLAPGFIDLQVNGGGDVLFNNAPDPHTLATMLQAHRGKGSTSILPTLLSATRTDQEAAVNAVRAARSMPDSGILGLHLEGPHFAPDRRGAHSEKQLRALLAEDVEWLCGLRDFPLMVTLAP
ncbi:MAG: N-acetylglucosamine-6-phosphate deacetylase, partial [Halioglobus sp.]|nr:N-acetylglucosamine-6-phosphate deacetylase [Halioglobus sp.]